MSMTEKRVGPESNPDMAPEPGPNAGMPAPSMNNAAQDQMPRPGSAAGGDAMGQGASSGAMPRPAMQAGSGGDIPRFPAPSDGPIGPRHEPGVVEVQFREGLMPRVIPGGPGQAPALAANGLSREAGVTLDDVNQLLRRYQVVSAEPTFIGTVEDGDQARVSATRQGIAVPQLSDFVTLHFASDANVSEIAEQLNQLSGVERAVPVPTARPPAELLAEAPPRPGVAPAGQPRSGR
jgi:hypothetical protein